MNTLAVSWTRAREGCLMWECLSSSVCGGYVRPYTGGTPGCAHFAKWTHYYLHFILKADYLSRSICLDYDLIHV